MLRDPIIGVFIKSVFCPLLFLIIAGECFAAQFAGIVTNTQGRPISKALVRLQGTSFFTFTNEKGYFEIFTADAVISKYITAWKNGFYNAGQPVSGTGKEYKIALKPIPIDDNKHYKWRSSLQDQISATAGDRQETKPCRDCHPVLTEQWGKSTHSGSATNPVFLAFFSGTDKQDGKDAGPTYKTDFPNANGNCSTCHLPAMALNNSFNSNPNEARGIEKEGIFCDLCHKIDNVRIDKTGGYPGILSIQFRRPSDDHQIFYGPYDDVFPGDDSYHPLYKESRYCAPCHNGKFWDIPIYSEFQEWSESSYAAKNIHCQDCHMAPEGKMTRFAPEKEGSVERNPETIPSHLFYGIGDRAFMSGAIDLNVHTKRNDDILHVSVTIKNIKAGHHYPSGNPMRNMILLVNAADDKGHSLSMLDGDKVPVWGGVGDVKEGNYAGLPGKGFAKVLRDSIPYPDQRIRHFQPEYPAPHWRPVYIESDNRIPAEGADISRYRYRIPADLSGTINVTARLIYRKAYKKWLDSKGLKVDEMEIALKSVTIGRK